MRPKRPAPYDNSWLGIFDDERATRRYDAEQEKINNAEHNARHAYALAHGLDRARAVPDYCAGYRYYTSADEYATVYHRPQGGYAIARWVRRNNKDYPA